MIRRLASFGEPFCPLPVYGHPKSGTTWMELLTSRLRLDVCKDHVEFCRDCTHRAKHRYTGLDMAHVSIYRHPCNVAVSMFYFGNSSLNINQFVATKLQNIIFRQNIQFKNERNAEIVYYEELCYDTARILKNVFYHFGYIANNSRIKQIVEETSFERMRSMEKKREMILSRHPDSYKNFQQQTLKHVMTRHGCNADHRTELHPKLIALCQSWLKYSLMYRNRVQNNGSGSKLTSLE